MEMESKIVKLGNSYGFTIPAGFIRVKTLEQGKRYKLSVEPVEETINSGVLMSPFDLLPAGVMA